MIELIGETSRNPTSKSRSTPASIDCVEISKILLASGSFLLLLIQHLTILIIARLCLSYIYPFRQRQLNLSLSFTNSSCAFLIVFTTTRVFLSLATWQIFSKRSSSPLTSSHFMTYLSCFEKYSKFEISLKFSLLITGIVADINIKIVPSRCEMISQSRIKSSLKLYGIAWASSMITTLFLS